MLVGFLAHSFATIANFQWFSKLPSPLNGMEWNGFPMVSGKTTIGNDGMVMYHCWSLPNVILLTRVMVSDMIFITQPHFLAKKITQKSVKAAQKLSQRV